MDIANTLAEKAYKKVIITHFPKGKSKVVLMNTRTGMLIGNFITPGLNDHTVKFLHEKNKKRVEKFTVFPD